jgi:hypothetical protein
MQATQIRACLHRGWSLWRRCCRTRSCTDINYNIPRKTTCLHTGCSLWRRCCRTARYAGNTNLRMSTQKLESVAQVLQNSLLCRQHKFAHVYTQAGVCGAGAAELLAMQATLICACLHRGWSLWHRCCRTPYYTDINLHIPRKTTCLHTGWSLWRRCCRTARYAGNTNLRMSTHRG